MCPSHWERNASEVVLLLLLNNNNNNNKPLLTTLFIRGRTGLNWSLVLAELRKLHLQFEILRLLSISLAFYCDLTELPNWPGPCSVKYSGGATRCGPHHEQTVELLAAFLPGKPSDASIPDGLRIPQTGRAAECRSTAAACFRSCGEALRGVGGG